MYLTGDIEIIMKPFLTDIPDKMRLRRHVFHAYEDDGFTVKSSREALVAVQGVSAFCYMIEGHDRKIFVSADDSEQLWRILAASRADLGDPVAAMYKVGTVHGELRYGPKEIYEKQMNVLRQAGILHG